ncbi:hypothetical protein J1N35_000508 [Gossypium stocksii]|uniref:Ionotropic glutamate receptor C-terminal domain-containing protein n=1 Tax=Gossypium stocksii TaxID=47602 RepID=A0A9D3WHC3_9ROSI|nr:hypothetical protein J1N35_000508 [Gossypium stocksii]
MKLMSLQTTVYVVHMSPILASQLFLNAKQLGMMTQGYDWITTNMITNFMNSMDPSVFESMQEVVGFKPHIPASKELRKFVIRWRSKNLNENKNLEEMEMNVYGIWSYDMVRAVATAAERIVQSRFKGISGGFQLTNGKLIPKEIEIVNVFKGVRIIGYWNPENGITSIMKEENHTETNSASSSELEGVIWPGGTMNIPKGWSFSGKRLRIGVPVTNQFRELISVAHDPQTNDVSVTGFCVDVFKEAVQSLDYEVHYDFIPFEDANGRMVGSYDDLILQVYHKNYDAVVGDLTIISRRFAYVDFMQPLTDLGIGVVVPKINNIWIFLKPLCGDLWIIATAFLIFTSVVIWFIEHPINEKFQSSPSEQIGMIFWRRANHSPEEYADALRRGSKNGGVSAVINEIPYLKVFLAKYPSDYTMIKLKAITGGFGFVRFLSKTLLTLIFHRFAAMGVDLFVSLQFQLWWHAYFRNDNPSKSTSTVA